MTGGGAEVGGIEGEVVLVLSMELPAMLALLERDRERVLCCVVLCRFPVTFITVQFYLTQSNASH